MATNGNFAHQEQYKSPADQYPSAPASADGTPNAAGNSNLSKDEVGWYFVEQYYTTLSKSPEKLHLFYGKRSQFVYGLEAEVANVSVGRQAIQERIKQLDFQDCKVRVSNVDSQATYDNIVIQVIGETSNKAAEPKKFVQTFVLAQQPSGYFVLNDILRYIDEEGDEDSADAVADAPVADEPVTMIPAAPAAASAEEVPAQKEAQKKVTGKLDADAVDQKLQEASKMEAAGINGHKVAEEKPSEGAPSVDVDATAQELADEDAKEPEKPQDPTPTPVLKPEPAAEPAAAPSEPAAPPKPMTWASRAAAAAGPRPVVPLPKTATPPALSQSRAPAPAPAPTPAAAGAPVPTATSQISAPAPAAETSAKESSGWQTAGADSKRQNRPQSISGNVPEKEGTMGYVKYVTEKVQDADLRGALAAHGELTYFDINRSKNCAFVEYKTVEGYQAAVSANPHTVNGENIIVEPRRPKSTAYGGSNYGSVRGNASGRGRGGFDGNRNGGQGNSRGNFSGQNRGRGGAPRGRGGSQVNNA
ncbi:NTF2 and RRM domain-containing protein [Drechmeria coniospora]|uniref:NTF2 and RRM domain-containing protein n=1 Tax=Drechmeria coniospora TaxID=98403 RepID=A0A151GSQ0_DRECN|nr:NTF2 and RRM domain-containing protein [Drechmeria coniospora]KYK60146.1 NTF2 and RRM domain-containing protein [Drechmeria coniospora]